jgi:hypothetical protein
MHHHQQHQQQQQQHDISDRNILSLPRSHHLVPTTLCLRTLRRVTPPPRSTGAAFLEKVADASEIARCVGSAEQEEEEEEEEEGGGGGGGLWGKGGGGKWKAK